MLCGSCAGATSRPSRFWTCKWVGVLDQIDALHLSNDTVIIFTSDHGYGALGNGATGAKASSL